MPFHLAFTRYDLGERMNAARCEIVDPGARLSTQGEHPLTIDHSRVVGADYTRNWQLRVFGSWQSFGLSIENRLRLAAGR